MLKRIYPKYIDPTYVDHKHIDDASTVPKRVFFLVLIGDVTREMLIRTPGVGDHKRNIPNVTPTRYGRGWGVRPFAIGYAPASNNGSNESLGIEQKPGVWVARAAG